MEVSKRNGRDYKDRDGNMVTGELEKQSIFDYVMKRLCAKRGVDPHTGLKIQK